MVDTAPFREIDACRICRGAELLPVIDLGVQALTGRFPAADEPDPPSAPLTLVRCSGCGLVQLKHSVQTTEMFGDNYGYRSGINATMRGHLSGIATGVAERARLQPGDVVLDIGCNDGTLLNSYPDGDIVRLGIDPIAEMFRDAYPAELRVHAGFFDADSFRAISPAETAKAITSISMFYDLEDPGSFVADIAAILAPDGVWVLEQSYLPSMLGQNSFDTICHEHLEYYGLAQIDRLVREHGLRIFDVSLNAINGGSFQLWVCHDRAGHRTNAAAVETLARREEELGLGTEAPYAAFRDNVARIGKRLRNLIVDANGRGEKVFVYGASTKGNVLLQHFGLDSRLIAGCADRNPIKWDRQTPGTRIPILSEEAARRDADYFLVLPWHFKDEFLKRESQFRSKGGRFIFPLPEVSVI